MEEIDSMNAGANMIEVQLSTQTLQKQIVAFHDNSVVFYFATGNQPYVFHVGHLKSIEVVEKKGRYFLQVSTGIKDNSEEFDPRMLPRVKELVAEVQKAMKSFSS
ncbi:MAG: hypothetical protein HGA86_06295 [Anaerolineaceae bacterium]|nr:hypothetical protein [Anaerolineaceae bacterium]